MLSFDRISDFILNKKKNLLYLISNKVIVYDYLKGIIIASQDALPLITQVNMLIYDQQESKCVYIMDKSINNVRMWNYGDLTPSASYIISYSNKILSGYIY